MSKSDDSDFTRINLTKLKEMIAQKIKRQKRIQNRCQLRWPVWLSGRKRAI